MVFLHSFNGRNRYCDILVKRLFLLLSAAFCLLASQVQATHIVGGELNYVHLGGNQYAVTLIIYRDCFGGQAAFDDPAIIGVFDMNGNLIQNLGATLDSVVPLQSTINSSCVSAPTNVCTEVGYYTEIVTLPPILGGYTLAYQRCCRNAVVQNVDTPGDVGATLVATIPGTESLPQNSNPIWNQLPPLYICAGVPFSFDQSASDLDGDSLVYSLCTPNSGANTNNPAPNPPAAPPYAPIVWELPYSLGDMLGGPAPFTIDQLTGQVTAVPGTQGTFLVGMCVSEYRNGVYLGETTREFQLSVVNCQAPVASPADLNSVGIQAPFTNCTEFVQFQATNSSGFSVFWDFGDPSNPLDQSTAQSPTWTYPGPGSYNLTLVVFNPISPNDPLCTDTVTQVVTIQPIVAADAGTDIGTCPTDPQQIGTPALPGFTYQWSPATGLDNATIAQPNAAVAQTTTYTVTVTDAVGCTDTDQVVVSLFGNTDADAGADQTICAGESTSLLASGGVAYQWSPAGSLSDANVASPVATPSVTTAYIVQVTNADGCLGADTVVVTIADPGITAPADLVSCDGDQVQLVATGALDYTWSPATGLSDPTVADPTAQPAVTTVYTVSGTDINGCFGSDDVTVTVSALPVISAGFGQGVCAGSDAQLNATGGTSYVWSPSAGLSNPNISNPIVTFLSDTMTFSVLGTDQFGCQNTAVVTVWQLDAPNVTAGPDTVICLGQSVNLNATGGTSYVWSPASGLNDVNIADPVATPLASTTYTVTVGQPSGNMVSNGDFTQGNVGFSSDYSFSNDLVPESRYSVVTNASSVHPAFQGVGHSGNVPNDNFLVVNGSSTAGLDVWCQSVSVTPNTEYYFGAWVSSVVASNPAILQFSINGQVLGSPFSAPFNINNWAQFFETWNSGAATSANICIVNQNTVTGGNDFGVDDITFSTLCYSTATVQVDVNPQPVANAGPDAAICDGATYVMQGSGGQTYQWVPPIGIDDASAANTNASPANTTTYTLVVEDNIGCSATDQMTLTVNPLPQANAGPDRTVCEGEGTVLQGSGGTTFVWTPATFLDDANQQLPISTPEQDIVYTVTVTDNNGCIASDQVNVTLNPLPDISAGVDSMICIGGSLVLNATGGNTYIWSPLFGLSDPQSATPTASPQVPTVYSVTGTDANGCVASDSVSVTFFTATAGPDSIICQNDSLQAFVSGGASFSWSPAEGVSDPTSGSPFLSPAASTTYTVTITSVSGCEDVAQVQVDILTLPVAAFTPTFLPSCDGIYAQFINNSENADTYAWNLGDGTTSDQANVTHTYVPGPGSVVTLTAFNNGGVCTDTLTIDFSNQWFGNDTIDILYPTFFSPNMDGVNDCFRPGFDGRFSDCYNLVVYNRWGALIYESTGGQNHCWDGRNKSGQPVDDGTYYYISQLNGVEKAGYVTLVR
jgi:gliding motility-associated-like protein